MATSKIVPTVLLETDQYMILSYYVTPSSSPSSSTIGTTTVSHTIPTGWSLVGKSATLVRGDATSVKTVIGLCIRQADYDSETRTLLSWTSTDATGRSVGAILLLFLKKDA